MDIYTIFFIVALTATVVTCLSLKIKQKNIIHDRDTYFNKMNEYAENEDELIQKLNNLQQQQHNLENDLAVKVSDRIIINQNSKNLEKALKEINIENIDNIEKLKKSEKLVSELKCNYDKEIENNKILFNKLDSNEKILVKLKERNVDLNTHLNNYILISRNNFNYV